MPRSEPACEVCGFAGPGVQSDPWALSGATACLETFGAALMQDVHHHVLCWACALELKTSQENGVRRLDVYPRCPDGLTEAELAFVVLAREGAPRE